MSSVRNRRRNRYRSAVCSKIASEMIKHPDLGGEKKTGLEEKATGYRGGRS
jgi:hypothetical protein